MAKVFFMNDRAQSIQTSLVAKMLTLFDAAEFGGMINPGDVVAIKLHMGEYNNTAYLRPVYAAALVEKIRGLGGDPMVVDTTTLPYFPTATRATALDYLNCAARNGFTSASLGCPVIIADGYAGTDDVIIDLPEGVLLKEQYIATGIAAADVMIALTHFKGHPMGAVGGAIKNIGVGCASKRGKANLHMGGHHEYGIHTRSWSPQRCKGRECPTWQYCESICPNDTFRVTSDSIEWNKDGCQGCMTCIGVFAECGVGGIPEDFFEASCTAIADSALAAVKAVGGPERVGYINLALDITPWCDCVSFSDRSILPNLGVFASHDPVALDSAVLGIAKDTRAVPGSMAQVRGAMSRIPKFTTCGSMMGISENIQANVGEKIGLGKREFELIEVPPADDPTPFMFSKVPIGMKMRRLVEKKIEVLAPSAGFKRSEKVDFEDLK